MAITEETLAVAARTRKRLQDLTHAQALALTAAWVSAWDSLAPDFEAAFLELMAGAKDGRVAAKTVAQNIRLRNALQQVRVMLDELTAQTQELLSTDVATAILDALDSHAALLQTQLPSGSAATTVTFNRTSPEALAALVERTTERIQAATRPLPADVERMMKQELIRGVAVGDNPRRTASRIMKRAEGRFNGGLSRALTISRTETLDAHRESTRQSRKANTDLVTGWRWMAMLDTRTCGSCLSNHGTLHDANDFGPADHPNGRCDAVDVIKSWADLGFTDLVEPDDLFPDAEEWFGGLTPAKQLQIMGPERLRLLNNGEVSWGDLSRKTENPDWRASMQLVPVKDLRPVA